LLEVVPLWLINVLSFAAVFSVMTAIGTTITPSACAAHIRSPRLLLRGLASVLVVVPLLGIATSFAFGLSLAEKVGITLIVIAPGAPLALRRALASGGDAGFAAMLQVAVAVLAVPAIPLWVIAGNWLLDTHGFVSAAAVARQVFLAQLLPLMLGALVKRAAPVSASWIGTTIGRAGAILLITAIASLLVDIPYSILIAHFRPIACAVVTTVAAIVVGHMFGAPSPETRHAVAIGSALRNVGLALFVASVNQIPLLVEVVILGYAITAIIIVTIYIQLRGPAYRLSWSKHGKRV
jgi:predicted Na+-dependent transporter